jgi:sterol desaturase/sphingolipid hydroxylase (fatty acid hydroxylase superfamily)
MTHSEPIDYRNSSWRAVLSWAAYPVLVLLPFAWLVEHLDVDNIGLLVAFAYISLLTTGILEWVQPYSRLWRRSHSDIVTDIAHQFLTGFIAQFIRVFLVVGFFLLIDRTTEDLALPVWPTHWPLWAQAILGLLVAEFADYWRHRLFHEWRLAWRLHAVHHCATRVYFLNANRFHVFDALVNSLVNASILALAGASTEAVYLVGIFTGLHSPWQHANVHYRLGWLNWVFAGAELHRWHHSTSEVESNSNYGNNLIVFDTLFGTRHLPARLQDTRRIGLGKGMAAFPRSWLGQQLAPFRWRAIRLPTEPVQPSQPLSDAGKGQIS